MKRPFAFVILLLILGMIFSTYSLRSSVLKSQVDNNFTIYGEVHEIVNKTEDYGKYIIKVRSIDDGITQKNIREKLLLKVIGDKNIDLGDKILFLGKLNLPGENTNPLLFNYRLNLMTDKIYTTCTIKDYSIIEVDKSNRAFHYNIKKGFRLKIENLFDEYLDEDNSSLMKSIIIGDYSYLDDKDISKYRDLGLAHILAVSGLHIGIISGFFIFILANLGVKRKTNYTLTLIIIWFYGYLIGFPPSLLRANIMLSIIFYGQIMAEPYDILKSLYVATFILLLFNPMWIFNLGFQLSVLATFSIVYFSPKINKLFYPYNNKITYMLSGLLAVLMGLLPVQAFYFNKISLLSILSNIIIAPILSISLSVGATMVGVSYVLPFLNVLIGKVLNILLSIQYFIVDLFHQIPWGVIETYSPNIFEFIIYYIIIFIIFKVISLKEINIKIKKLIFYYLTISIIVNFALVLKDDSIEFHFIDVGQGDSVLIRTKKHDYLLDTGGSILDSWDVGEYIVLPYLQKIGVRNLRGVFITHFHHDHCKSLPLLMENLNIENILISYKDHNSEIYGYLRDKEIPTILLKENDFIYLDKNTSIVVLNPRDNILHPKTNANNLSLVFLLNYYNRNLLFSGDMEKEVEEEILNKINETIDIIKVPHHGSNTSSTEEFLNKTTPEIAIVSVGKNNFYGHPSNEVISRYENLGSNIYRTDIHGMIKVKLDKNNLEILPFIKEERSFVEYFDDNVIAFCIFTMYCTIFYIFIRKYEELEKEMKYIGLQ